MEEFTLPDLDVYYFRSILNPDLPLSRLPEHITGELRCSTRLPWTWM